MKKRGEIGHLKGVGKGNSPNRWTNLALTVAQVDEKCSMCFRARAKLNQTTRRSHSIVDFHQDSKDSTAFDPHRAGNPESTSFDGP